MLGYIWWHWIIKGDFHHKRMLTAYWYLRTKNLERSMTLCMNNRVRYERLEKKYEGI